MVYHTIFKKRVQPHGPDFQPVKAAPKKFAKEKNAYRADKNHRSGEIYG